VTVVAPTGLRELKKERTRKALSQAALTLFARQGFERTTVEEIAAACEVSPRTFFRYFATKEDVLFSDADERMQQLVDAIATSAPGVTPLQAIRTGVLSLVGQYEHDREQMQARAQVFESTEALRVRKAERMPAFEQSIVELLSDANPRRDDFGLRLVVAAGTAALRTSLDAWLADDHTDLRRTIDTAFTSLARGLDAKTR
jgi:AcrR family transcriptional regulator